MDIQVSASTAASDKKSLSTTVLKPVARHTRASSKAELAGRRGGVSLVL
jgi:hypothetical protein